MLTSRLRNAVQTIVATSLVVMALLLLSVLPTRAEEYNCGAYGAGTYQNNVCAASTDTGAGTPQSGGGSLVNTGQTILAILIPTILILTGTLLLWRTRRNMKKRQIPPQL